MKRTHLPRGRPANPAPSNAVTKASLTILKRVVAGELLYGTRTFPHPHRFKMSGVNGSGGCDVALTIIDDLVSHHLIDAIPADPKKDTISYRATDAGRAYLTAPPGPDATQLDWVGSDTRMKS